MTTDQDKEASPVLPQHSAENINDEILKLEYAGTSSLFESSEEFGEKRTTLMITITGVLFGSFFALLKNKEDYFFKHAFIFWLMIMAIFFLLVLGGLTLLRMAHRNITTDEYKATFRQIGKFYVNNSPGLKKYLYFDPDEELKNRKDAPFKGGYIEIIKLINSVVCGLFVYMFLSYFNGVENTTNGTNIVQIFLIAFTTAGSAWIVQLLFTEKIYDNGYEKYKKRLAILEDMNGKIKAIFSKEVRWFVKGKNYQIERWFNRNGSSFKKQKERFDYYLNMLPLENISCKIREGKAEFKKQIGPLSTNINFEKFNGKVENWVKWSSDLKDSLAIPDQIDIDSNAQFIVIKKTRVLVIFKVEDNKPITRVKNGNYPKEGCQVEYTRIKVGEKDEWYSFGFEAFGSRANINRNFELVTNHVLGQMPGVSFEEKYSYGYPRFLKDFYLI